MKKTINRILTVLFALVFLISAFMIVRYYIQSRQAANIYEKLAEQVHQEERQNDSTGEEESAGKPLSQYVALKKQFPNMVGWIRIDGTVVDYPVTQGENNSYYLHHAFDGSESAHGCIFADKSCDMETPSDNIILYGHHMKDGSMFAVLDQYKKKTFWQDHPVIHFDTLTSSSDYEVMAAFAVSVDTGNEAEFRYYDFVEAKNKQDFDKYVKECLSRSLYSTGVTAKAGDQLLTLSTCEYSRNNGRMVVVAKKVN